jgi:single-strand DNA-binding protein
MARSLNKVTLIGNLTRDPELRYTPSGTAVASFSIATNRQWRVENETKEDVEFHRIVAWDKLAEICGQLLKKGSKTYVEGRLQTRKWQTKDGEDRTTTEIVISEMMLLDSRGDSSSYDSDPDIDVPDDFGDDNASSSSKPNKSEKAKPEKKDSKDEETDDIPF